MDVLYYQAVGNSIHAQNNWTTLIYIIFFTLGAMMFYSLLYKSKLLPRFISIWGLIAAAFLLIGALIGLFDLYPLVKVMSVFSPPIILNEFTLAVWLIVKGFYPAALASGLATTNH